MKTHWSLGNISRLLMTTVFTITVIGCADSNQKGKDEGSTSFVTLSEKASACETQIRAKMEGMRLFFKPVSQFQKEIDEAGSTIALIKSHQTLYKLRQEKSINTGLEVSFNVSSQRRAQEFSYSLSVNDSNSENPLSLSIAFQTYQDSAKTKLSQTLSVDENCTPHLNATSLTKKQRVGNSGKYTYNSQTIFADGGNDESSAEFQLTENQRMIENLNEALSSAKKYEFVSFDTILGLVTLQQSDTVIDTQFKEFGMEFSLPMKTSKLLHDGKVLATIQSGALSELGLGLDENHGNRNWTLPLKIWQEQALGSSRDFNGLFASELPEGYLETNHSILLMTNKRPSYEHFEAYWQVSDGQLDENNKLKSVLLTEASAPDIDGETTDADLASNDTIQTELPQIQKIAERIRQQAPNDAAKQVMAILKELKAFYSYDSEMVKNNSVRPFTTEEALKRGKGVCQHYAVIFTAIARALKIPTRIISGFYLNQKSPGAHAWVEVQVEKGKWRALEPQEEFGLTTTQRRFYFPIGRAKFLENHKTFATELIADLLERSSDVLKPAP